MANSSTCTATVTIEDTVAPVAVCQDITIQLDSTGNASITAMMIDGGSSDACGIDSLVASMTSFTCADTGANAVTLTVIDVNGNQSSCVSNVTVEDTIAPIALCQDLTVYLDSAGTASITAAMVDNGSSDNCAIDTLTLDISTFDCSDESPLPVVFINEFHYDNVGTDANEAVEIIGTAGVDLSGWTIVAYNGSNGADYDTQPLGGVLTNQSNGFGFAVVNYPTNGLQNGAPDGIALVDNMGNVVEFLSYEGSFTATLGPAAGMTSTDVGVSEGTGNSNQSIQRIGSGSQASDFSWLANINSTFGGVNSLQTLTQSGGPVTVTMTVTDVNGNSSTCTSTVTVEDTVAPELVCNNDTVYLDSTGNGSLVVGDIATFSDACGIDTFSVSQTDFDCVDASNSPVSVSVDVYDVNGNMSSCTVDVSVVDTVAPFINNCPMDQTLSNVPSNCGANAFWTRSYYG